MTRQLHLNLFVYPGGHHEAAWRYRESAPERVLDLSYYVELARAAEAATFDGLFLADGPSLADNIAYATRFRLEPFTLLSALAAVGMRNLSAAESILDEVCQFAHEREDLFLLVNASAVLARLHIARGDCRKASAATAATYDTSKVSILQSEYQSVRAVVLAALGDGRGARAASGRGRG